ncbi:hypothetical protein BDZ89DRAFT_1046343 [Hymenopellis radicata]|nr:hypothetical protein BDZ89DRAFT_1046343 [Hymenopellis radicata]
MFSRRTRIIIGAKKWNKGSGYLLSRRVVGAATESSGSHITKGAVAAAVIFPLLFAAVRVYAYICWLSLDAAVYQQTSRMGASQYNSTRSPSTAYQQSTAGGPCRKTCYLGRASHHLIDINVFAKDLPRLVQAARPTRLDWRPMSSSNYMAVIQQSPQMGIFPLSGAR